MKTLSIQQGELVSRVQMMRHKEEAAHLSFLTLIQSLRREKEKQTGDSCELPLICNV